MIDLQDYGYMPTGNDDENIARVTAVFKERYGIVCQQGESFARLKSAVYYSGKSEMSFPTVGDFVRIQYNSEGDSLITETLERRSFFSRLNPTPGMGEQAVAANFDYVFILTSLNYDFNEKRLQRYLTLTWQSGALPVVVLTKSDLTEDYAAQQRLAEAAAPGVGVFAVSARTGAGLEHLSSYLGRGKTIVFLGSSGVGKSSLLNALAGEELMKVGEIREDDSRGRHTTTHRQLYRLNSGAMVIDTPGMRSVGMWDVTQGLSEAFTDVEDYLGRCRFSDCTHGGEPGCAVQEAIIAGELSRERWEAYLQLKREARYSDDKGGYLREKQRWHKTISKWNKQRRKTENRRD